MRTRLNIHVLPCFALLACVITGCMQDPKSGQGFTLPDGNAERGQETFAALQCHACHTVDGVEFADLESAEEAKVALGGERSVVITYGNLVTSIINPSHRFAFGYSDEEIKEGDESKMRVYNDEMTITQLMDLVAFLQSRYEIRGYQPTPYMPYY